MATGCAVSLPPVTVEDARRVGIPLEDLEEGRSRYVAKCSGCHGLYSPGRFDDAEWTRQMDWMATRVQLGREERRSILVYLQALNTSADSSGDGEEEVRREDVESSVSEPDPAGGE